PGASVASWAKLRVAIGRFATASVAMVNDRSPDCDLTAAPSALTSTTSAVPTVTTIGGTPIPSPGLTCRPARRAVRDPLIDTSIAERPGARFRNEYPPPAPGVTGTEVPRRVHRI